jgi:hypothetical protein
MDEASDKFNELSPVLELVYVTLTSMVRYLDLYATDIEATTDEQYLEAKSVLDEALKKLDSFYGIDSSEDLDEDFVEEAPAKQLPSMPVPAPVVAPVNPQATAPSAAVGQPYEFAAGEDEESMQKAKQAVEELKSLFADMKKKEAEIADMPLAPADQQPQMSATMPVPQPPAPFVPVAPVVQDPAQMVPPTPMQVPTPMNPQQPAKDATEIDSILAELRKLQNKGTQQL